MSRQPKSADRARADEASARSTNSRPTYEALLARVAQLEQQQQQQQQQQLMERERLLALINNLPDDVFFVDATGKVVLANAAARSSLGVSEKEDLYKRLAETESMFEVYASDGHRRRPDESPLLAALKGETVQGDEIVRNVRTPASYGTVDTALPRCAWTATCSVRSPRSETRRKQSGQRTRCGETQPNSRSYWN